MSSNFDIKIDRNETSKSKREVKRSFPYVSKKMKNISIERIQLRFHFTREHNLPKVIRSSCIPRNERNFVTWTSRLPRNFIVLICRDQPLVQIRLPSYLTALTETWMTIIYVPVATTPFRLA